jgi:hypothetical protein
MTVLNIEGKNVTVDDSFLSLTPEQQADTVDEIAKSIGVAPAAQADTPDIRLGADRRQADDAQVQQQTAEGRQEAYDQKPWYQQAMQAAQDEARLLGTGATFGFSDKINAVSDPTKQDGILDKAHAILNMVNPAQAAADVIGNMITGGDDKYKENVASERSKTQAARDRAGLAALPTEIIGGVMTGGALARSGATLAGRIAAPGLAGTLTRAAVMAPEGAAYGTIDALGNDTDVKKGAITGAIAGPVGSVVGDTISAVASRVLPRRASNVPSLDQLRTQAHNAYDAADHAGVIVTPQAVQRLNQAVQNDLANFGYDPALQPGIAAVLTRLNDASQGNVTLRGLDLIRRVANNARMSNNRSEAAAGNLVIDNIDHFINGLRPADVLTGNQRQGVAALQQARQLWTRVAKNERFVNAVEAAQLRAASTGSGGNVENATRQNLRRFIDPTSNQRMRNLTPAEHQAIEEIVRGTPGQNFLRLAGKLSPQGNGLMAALGIGGAMVNPTFGVASLGGLAAKTVADRSVINAVAALDELIRAGGTQAARQQAQAALRNLTAAQRQTVAQMVLQPAVVSQTRQEEPAQ